MLNDLIKAIAKSIYAEFGDDYEIYIDKVEQGLLEPCFLVRIINPINKPLFGKRRQLDNIATIQYFPKKRNSFQECNEVYERLIDALEIIQLNSSTNLRGTNPNFAISDGVATLTIDYDFFGIREESGDSMEELTVINTTTEGV